MAKKRKNIFNYDDLAPKDLRRTWLILGALRALERPTTTSIANNLGYYKNTVSTVVDKLNSEEFPLTVIDKIDAVYIIKEWGMAPSPELIDEYYENYFNQ